jgi:hypothetical protein
VAVSAGRDAALKAAWIALEGLAVNRSDPFPGMSEQQIALRERLVAWARQTGCRDVSADMKLLAEEAAYEYWHRMLFARYLADNDLLMYADGETPITIGECGELAYEEGAGSGWELAGRLAALMLPQVFRPDSPVFELTFPPELEREMESLVSSLPSGIFMDPGFIGASHGFWADPPASASAHVSMRGGAERFKTDFLAENCLGAWWTAKISGRLDGRELKPGASEMLQNAETEEELRDFFGIPGEGGLRLNFMRFVRADEKDGKGENDEQSRQKGQNSRWMPAAGWPDDAPLGLSGFTVLDPCCGTGQFLISVFCLLVPMRMFLEGLSASEAADAALAENIHGLEADSRRAGLAAFALALAAWKYPGAGYRRLPEMNIACSGLSAGADKKDWESLAEGSRNLRIALGMMHETFRDAPVLGSLIDPARSDASVIAGWETGGDRLTEAIKEALGAESGGTRSESAIAAQGLAKTAELLSRRYSLVATNVPSLPRARQDERLRRFCAKYYPRSKDDLAGAVVERSLRLCAEGGDACFVLPEKFVPEQGGWRMAAKLDSEKTVLVIMSARERLFQAGSDEGKINCVTADRIAESLRLGEIRRIFPAGLRGVRAKRGASSPLKGKSAGPRLKRKFWELPEVPESWGYFGESWIGPHDENETRILPDNPGETADTRRAKNPADWSFPGHPCAASDGFVLHAAAARLLGYRWPAERDCGIELPPDALDWKERCHALLRFATEDGIACVSPVPGETPLADRLLDILATSYGEGWSGSVLSSLLTAAGCAGKNLDFWLRNKFFAQHCRLFKNRPFIWHVWDGQKDGFSALVNYHALDSGQLETLVYSCLGDWIRRSREEGREARARVSAAERLKKSLELILEGKAPRGMTSPGKPAWKHRAGWAPDLTDGIAVNIMPFLNAPPVRAASAGVLRNAPFRSPAQRF